MNHSANRIGSHVTIPSCSVVNGLIVDQRDLDTELMVKVETRTGGEYQISRSGFTIPEIDVNWYRLPIVDGEIPADYATFTD